LASMMSAPDGMLMSDPPMAAIFPSRSTMVPF
jgi:hypothetical protein